jgi:hypothetical protein
MSTPVSLFRVVSQARARVERPVADIRTGRIALVGR